MPHFLQESITDFRLYQEQIQRIHEKQRSSNKFLSLNFDEEQIRFNEIARNSRSFSRAMVQDLKSGKYTLKPAQISTILVKNKKRTIYKFKPTDRILHGVVSKILNTYFESKYSSNLYSYRQGKNYCKALQNFANYCRHHYKSIKNPLERGIYVIRRDIADYTNTVPTAPNSPLWSLIKSELEFPDNPTPEESTAWDYLTNVIRTEICISNKLSNTKTYHIPDIGVPTGSPISTTIYNLYLINLDKRLDALNLEFYCRYGDDILIADKDPLLIAKASKVFTDTIKEHKLTSRKEKEKSLFLNSAGRSPSHALSDTNLPNFIGSQKVNFLGSQISLKGEISLHKKNESELLKNLNDRLDSSLNFQKKHESELGSLPKLALCINVINKALDPDNKFCQKSAPILRHLITDRNYLKYLDYKIAQIILNKLLNSSSPKGFRKLSIKTMRQKGLISLVNKRNHYGKKRYN